MGRSKSAEIRGCGDVIANKVVSPVRAKLAEDIFTLHYFESTNSQNTVPNLNIIEKVIRISKILSTFTSDEIILVFREAAKSWRMDKSLEKYKYDGLDFIIDWILSGKLEKI